MVELEKLDDVLKSLEELKKEIREMREVLDQHIKTEQQMYQLMGIIGHLLKEIASFRQELASLKAARGDSG